nr:hypothetical protein [Bacteroidota bacterium]
MKSFKTTIFFVYFLSSFLIVNAQEVSSPDQEATSDEEAVVKTLQHQFQNIKDKSNTYQEYKVVKVTNLNNFWDNVKDSLEAKNKEYLAAIKVIEGQKTALQKIEEAYNVKDAELQKGDHEKAHISVLGMDVVKSNYIYFNTAII